MCVWGISLLVTATTASAQVAAEAGASAKVAVGEQPDCKKDPKRNCIPADVVTYAPFSLRVGRWDLNGVSRDYEPTQFTVGINPDVTAQAMGATTRTIIKAQLGGGNSGFEWDLGGIWMFGGRLSVGQGRHGGPFARLGLDANLGGNSDYYHSHLELPRFELGYQFIKTDSLFVEAAGRGGLTLVGRRRIFDDTRDIGFSLDAGGFLTLQMQSLRANVDLLRIYEDEHAPKTPIDRGQLDLCGLLGGLALCFTASVDRSDMTLNGQTTDTRADFIGGKLEFTDARITRMGL